MKLYTYISGNEREKDWCEGYFLVIPARLFLH